MWHLAVGSGCWAPLGCGHAFPQMDLDHWGERRKKRGSVPPQKNNTQALRNRIVTHWLQDISINQSVRINFYHQLQDWEHWQCSGVITAICRFWKVQYWICLTFERDMCILTMKKYLRHQKCRKETECSKRIILMKLLHIMSVLSFLIVITEDTPCLMASTALKIWKS